MENTYSTTQISRLLNVSATTVYRWIQTGQIKAIKHPLVQRWIVPESAIEELCTGIRKSRRAAPRGKEDVAQFFASFGRGRIRRLTD